MIEKIFFTITQDILFLGLLLIGAIVFGKAFYKIYRGEPVFAKKAFTVTENGIFKAMGIDSKEEYSAKKYAICVLIFSGLGLLMLFAILMGQSLLTMNPEGIDGMSWHLAFNTAASFITNTNWQAYSGETQLSYFSQMIGLTVQNFLSGAVGIAVLFALIRGFTRKETKHIGNFWVDITRITLFMLPICFVGAIVLVSQGVPQTMNGSVSYIDFNGEQSSIFLGPAASQVIIKQLFTNGGGFYGVNSAFPFENPTPLSNLIQSLSLLMIPAGLVFTFGKAIKNRTQDNCTDGIAIKEKNQGIPLLIVMTSIFIVCLTICTACEFLWSPSVDGISAFGNMEGKEVRFGVGASSLWATATTAVSNGSVNSMHSSYTSIGGMIPLFLMMLGEIVYGGVGCGLYGMLAFAILTVFISGLMVGRTPEYLGKKIGSFDMKMVCLVILLPVLMTLIGTASTVMLPKVGDWLTNSGAHGFTEILYAFTSMANNNGSAFAGFSANTVWTNVAGGIIMIVVRFIPMIAIVFLAGSLGKKKNIPQTEGTLSTTNTMFVMLLIAVILIVGALSFFPALSLGPIAEAVS